MKISKQLFSQFSKRFSNYPHTFFPSSSIEHVMHASLAEWKSAECPYQWVQVEEANGYQAWLDFAYRFMALTFGDNLLGIGGQSRVVVPDDEKRQIVFLDKEHFGVPNYLYFSNDFFK